MLYFLCSFHIASFSLFLIFSTNIHDFCEFFIKGDGMDIFWGKSWGDLQPCFLDVESEDGAQVLESGVGMEGEKGGGKDRGMWVQAQTEVKRGKKISSPFWTVVSSPYVPV